MAARLAAQTEAQTARMEVQMALRMARMGEQMTVRFILQHQRQSTETSAEAPDGAIDYAEPGSGTDSSGKPRPDHIVVHRLMSCDR